MKVSTFSYSGVNEEDFMSNMHVTSTMVYEEGIIDSSEIYLHYAKRKWQCNLILSVQTCF